MNSKACAKLWSKDSRRSRPTVGWPSSHFTAWKIASSKTFSKLLSETASVFFIGQTVFRLVESKGLESEKRTLAAEISELELQTLSLNDTISIDKAYELGFVDAPDTQFVTQKAVVTIR